MASVGIGETAPNAAWLARKIAGSREARRPLSAWTRRSASSTETCSVTNTGWTSVVSAAVSSSRSDIVQNVPSKMTSSMPSRTKCSVSAAAARRASRECDGSLIGAGSSSIMYRRSRSTTATERPLLRNVAARADATVLLPAAIGPLMTNSLLIQSAFRARRRGARHAGPAHAAPLPRRL